MKNIKFGLFGICLMLAVMLLFPMHDVRAEDFELQDYNFRLQVGVTPTDGRTEIWRTVNLKGYDIDFFSVIRRFKVDDDGSCYVHTDLYAISRDIFEGTITKYSKNPDGKISQNTENAIIETREVSGGGKYYISRINFSAAYDSFALAKQYYFVSGFPNVFYIGGFDADHSKTMDEEFNRIVREQSEKFVNDGGLDWEPVDLDKDGVLDLNMEIPVIKMDPNGDGGYDFVFDNAAYDTYFELQGRWYTVDDINLFKENAVWKYSYQSLLKSDLITWVSPDDKATSIGTYDLCDVGGDAFNSFLNAYPIESRSYTGGTNALGNWLNGYNDALSTLQEFLLPEPTSLFNGCEIYVRYYCFLDDGTIHYSKWTHWYDALADSAGSSGRRLDDSVNMDTEYQSQSGLTDDEKKYLEDNDYSRNDVDVSKNVNNYDVSNLEQAVGSFNDILGGMVSFLGDFPSLISAVFSFLPEWVIVFVGLGLAVLVILRLLGR